MTALANVIADAVTEILDEVHADFLDVDQTTPLELGLDVLNEQHRDYFDREESPTGEKWAPNAASTARKKGHDIVLQDSQDLIQSLVEGGPHAIREVVNEPAGAGLSHGTRVPYSGLHDEPSGNRPARRHVGAREENIDEIAGLALDHTLDELSR